jgi:3-dehydroquinate synthase
VKATPHGGVEQAAEAARTVLVRTGRPYPVVLGRGVAGRAAAVLAGLEPPLGPRGWALVSDAAVAALHGPTLRAGLGGWPAPAAAVLLPQGEGGKTWEAAGAALRRLARAGLGRGGVVVCLGGGAVTDAGGFAAAVFLRGVDHVNVPTTLLGAVDAAIGGKTGVDLPEGKNLAGAFHQPRAVLVDPDLLATLPPREWRNGWAEVIKVAITSDAGLLELLERAAPTPAGALEPAALETAIERACRAKADVVAVDEREADARRVLNFGHTVGHAIEAAGDFARWRHGEAVALGIACVLELGVRTGVTPAAFAERARELLRRYGLPVSGSGFAPEDLAPFLLRDKKVQAGEPVVVLTAGPGRPILRRFSPGDPDLHAAIRSVA